MLLLLLAGFYAYRQKRRAERADHQNNPFGNYQQLTLEKHFMSTWGWSYHFNIHIHAALWDPSKNSGGVPQLKGARSFSFEELKKYTNNFSETNNIGSGGYGMVSFDDLLYIHVYILCGTLFHCGAFGGLHGKIN